MRGGKKKKKENPHKGPKTWTGLEKNLESVSFLLREPVEHVVLKQWSRFFPPSLPIAKKHFITPVKET